jgi:HEAT repeat protein
MADLMTEGIPIIPMLIAALADANPDVRWRVIVTLGWIGDSQAIEPLVDALSDSIWEVRQNAAWALGQIGGSRAAKHLSKAMYDEDEQVCVLATYALARIGEIEQLHPGLHEHNEHARRAASAALSLLMNAS